MKTYSRKKADEQEEVILDLNELCRLCMTKEDQLVSIFENDGPVSLPLRIMACVALEVSAQEKKKNKLFNTQLLFFILIFIKLKIVVFNTKTYFLGS